MAIFRLFYSAHLYSALPGLFAKNNADTANFVEIILPYAVLLSIMLTIIIAISIWCGKENRIKKAEKKSWKKLI